MLLGDAKTPKSSYAEAVAFCSDNKANIKTAAYVFGGTSAINAKVWNALVATTK
jgi:hypothetical protein